MYKKLENKKFKFTKHFGKGNSSKLISNILKRKCLENFKTETNGNTRYLMSKINKPETYYGLPSGYVL